MVFLRQLSNYHTLLNVWSDWTGKYYTYSVRINGSFLRYQIKDICKFKSISENRKHHIQFRVQKKTNKKLCRIKGTFRPICLGKPPHGNPLKNSEKCSSVRYHNRFVTELKKQDLRLRISGQLAKHGGISYRDVRQEGACAARSLNRHH